MRCIGGVSDGLDWPDTGEETADIPTPRLAAVAIGGGSNRHRYYRLELRPYPDWEPMAVWVRQGIGLTEAWATIRELIQGSPHPKS